MLHGDLRRQGPHAPRYPAARAREVLLRLRQIAYSDHRSPADRAVGIALRWAAGVEVPFHPPPGLVILTSGAAFVALARWAWAPAVGAFMGLFVIVGFIASSVIDGEGTGNLTGDADAGGVVGTVLQLVGVIAAFVAGVIAVKRDYRVARPWSHQIPAGRPARPASRCGRRAGGKGAP